MGLPAIAWQSPWFDKPNIQNPISTMTFEEFFKKKKINLTLLKQGNGGLFSEFKEHFEAMGEKSFDHTKKYWFNSLRRLYPLPPEIKAEKIVIENKLAEQTVAETLTAQIVETEKKVGFTPRFKAGTTAKPQNEIPAANVPEVKSENAQEEIAAGDDKSKVGFKPRFKAGVTAKKPEEQSLEEKGQTSAVQPANQTPVEADKHKVGFKPRFKAGLTTNKPDEQPLAVPEEKIIGLPPQQDQEKPAETTKPSTGFKPRFKAGVTKTTDVPANKPDVKESATVTPEVNEAAEQQAQILQSNPDADINQVKPEFEKEKEKAQDDFGSEERTPQHLSPDQVIASKSQTDAASAEAEKTSSPKIGFKPRFKAGVTDAKPPETQPENSTAAETQPATPEQPETGEPKENDNPKLGFKPRFKPKQ